MDDQLLRQRLAQYPFYHIIPLTEHVSTPGSPVHVKSQQPVLAAIRRIDLQGKRVLDIGCRDGLYSLTAEKQGAAEVVAFDNDLSHGAVDIVLPTLKSRVQMHELNVYDLTPQKFGTFDLVIFAGVLYHLRYPMWALKLIRDVLRPGGRLILETAIFYGQEQHAMMYCPIQGESPYEPTSCTFFNRKGLVDTLTTLGFTCESMTVLHPDAGEAATAGTLSPAPDGGLVVDRGLFVGQYGESRPCDATEEYWHGCHTYHSRITSSPSKKPATSVQHG